MATPPEKLAESLSALKALQDGGTVAIRASDLSRTNRERLLKNGFIQQVMKGWYVAASPGQPAGETTGWYAAYWPFCAAYLNVRFGEGWCLSPDQSLSLHVGNWTVPKRLMVRSPRGGNKPTDLLHGTSLFDLRLDLPPAGDMEIKDGLRLFSVPAASVHIGPGQFTANPLDVRAALAMIADASDVLRHLLAGGHTIVAGRLAGAFRNIGRNEVADTIVETMKAAGYAVAESDPFADRPPVAFAGQETSPYVNRLRMSWQAMRAHVIANFPQAPGLPTDAAAYLKRVEAIYVSDAYHSLSIEGYRVSAELIERVRSRQWNPEAVESDREHRNALAARGYWQAFQRVEDSIREVLNGVDPGRVAETGHRAWYRELFGPSVVAGIIGASDLAGYRNAPVYIRRSMHVPPGSRAVRELMPAFFMLLQEEKDAAVRVVLGHFFFVYIHPYMDGNGRMGRFLMNVMMASGGYPWTVVPVERRDEYMASLEAASVDQDIVPLTRFIADLTQSTK